MGEDDATDKQIPEAEQRGFWRAPLRWARTKDPAEGEGYYAPDDGGRWSRNRKPF